MLIFTFKHIYKRNKHKIKWININKYLYYVYKKELIKSVQISKNIIQIRLNSIFKLNSSCIKFEYNY